MAPALLLLLGIIARTSSIPRLLVVVGVAGIVVLCYIVCRILLGLPMGEISALTHAFSIRYLLAVAESILIYTKLYILPVGLHIERFLDIPQTISFGMLASAFVVMLALFFTSRAALRGSDAAMWILWALIALFPVSNLIPLYPGMASRQIFLGERFLYMPCIALAAATILFWNNIRCRIPRHSSLLGIIGVVAILLLGMLTYNHNPYWADEATLYSLTLQYYPGSVRMREGLGLIYADEERYDEAIELLAPVAEQNPLSLQAHLNLGNTYRRKGRFDLARRELEKAHAVAPAAAEPLNVLGLVAMAEGKNDEAAGFFIAASKAAPLFPAAYVNLSIVQLRQGDADSAERNIQKALSLDPELRQDVMLLMATCHEKQGMVEKAIEDYRIILKYGYPGVLVATDKLEALMKQP